LTQKLCKIVTQKADRQNPNIQYLIEQYIVKNWNVEDHPQHFGYIKNRILKDQQRAVDILEMYKRILANDQIVADDDRTKIELRLSGLVMRTKEAYLEAFNPIYKQVFNLDWVNKQLAEIRPYSAKFKAWLEAKEEIKQRYLLYGKELENALKWAENKNISNDDHQFLNDSQMFSQRVSDWVPENSDYEAIINAVFSWTGGVNFLNHLIFKEARNFTRPIKIEQAEKWLEKNLIPKLKLSKKLRQQFYEITDRILKDTTIYPVLLLFSYLEILEKQEVKFNHSQTHQKLIDMCLVIKEDGQLKILNKIYRSIFDKKWVEDQLYSLCPYAKEFQAWQASRCQNNSLLLKGEDLQKAVEWIQNKEQLSKEQLSEPEIEFIITSLEFIITSVVWKMWQSDDAVNKVKEFLPQLQEQTNTPAHLVRVIQVILQGTRPQLVLLEDVLQWVGDAEVIPTEDEAKWLEGVARSRIKDSNAQKLAEYLDFDDHSEARWQKLKDERAFRFIYEFIHKYGKRKQPIPQDNERQPSPSMEEINNVKNYKVILDEYQASSHNRHDTGSVTNFQRLISDALYRKLKKADNMAGQQEFDQLLDKIVKDAGGDIEAIIIFDLSEGLPLYHNKGLKDRNARLYSALFGEEDDIGGEAIEGFNTLNKMQKAFNKFGEKTEFGEQKSIHVNFANGKMMIYFYQAPDIPTAICFMASKDINLGSINRRANQVITDIKQKLDEL
jgi:hypothetical protein